MGKCKIVNCETQKGQKTLFRVPLDPTLRTKWIKQIQKHQQFDEVPITYLVCSDHFNENEIVKVGRRTTLKPGAVPTLFPDHDGSIKIYLPAPEVADINEQIDPIAVYVEESDTVAQKASCSDPAKTKNHTREAEPQKENEMPNVDQSTQRKFEVTASDYNRYLQLEIQLNKYKVLCDKKAKEIKRLQDQVAYYKKKIFKQSGDVPDDTEEIEHTPQARILQCLAHGRDKKCYNEDVRTFCLTLNFYKPRAYSYVRSKFNNNLPSSATIRNWYRSLNASPGLTTESFDNLKKKADEVRQNTGSKLLCNLIFDEMKIHRHAQWNAATMKFDGFVDVGRQLPNQESLPLANDALVYMISGMDEDFKIPIAYFLTNGLAKEEKAAITNEILIRLSEIGIEVVAIIFDGLPSNLAILKEFDSEYAEGTPYIIDPTNKHRNIYILLDVAHMLKLFRNCIASRNLIDEDGGIISWQYIRFLYEEQKNLSWNLSNKLTKSHILWDKRKMNVKLAAETLSASVADSLEFMKQKDEKFKDVDATVKYIRMINDTFDIMNSTLISKNDEGFKRPITSSNAAQFFQRFQEVMPYLKSLTVEGEKKTVFFSASKTPFIGFYNNMLVFMRIYDEYIGTRKIEKIIAHRFSQDLLESFFSSIRTMGGCNDNPTAQQFEAAYRKLLIHNDVVCSKKANIIEPGTKILTVSSFRKPVQKSTDQNDVEFDECFDDDYNNSFRVDQYVDDIHCHSLAYMASILEAKIITGKRRLVKCDDCIKVFIENELIEDSFIRFKARQNNIMQPCKSTFAICKFVNTYIKSCEERSASYQEVVNIILRRIPFTTLYTSSDFEEHSSRGHKYDLVKTIVELYMHMKSVHIAKCYTLDVHEDPVRHNLRKLTHDLGQ